MNIKTFIICCSALVLSGCVTTSSKEKAFPAMYDTNVPKNTVLVAPVINDSTSSEASEYLASTLAEPLVNKGYYVLPIPITADIFKQIGIVDGRELKGIPFDTYKNKFGADSVLFVTISKWDTNYMVLAGNVEVELKYVMVSTNTGKIIWSYQNSMVVDTTSSSGSILVDLVATAISTAATDYIPVAQQVNAMTSQSLPVGIYHPKHLKDGKQVVLEQNVISASKSFSEQ